MNRKRVFLFLILISLSIFTSGCWSQKELNEIAIVAAIGIDKNKEGKYVGTFEILNPGNVSGGLQGGGGGSNPPISVYTATGDSLFEIDAAISSKISREPYYAHTNLIVIGEKLARDEGLTKLLDVIERSPEFRSTAQVVIAQDAKAEELLNVLTGIDKVPSEKILKTLESSEKLWGQNLTITVDEVIRAFTASGREPVISGFKINGDPEKGKTMEQVQKTDFQTKLVLGDLGVFKEGKLIDWLRDDAAKGTVWALDKIQSTVVTIDWEKEKEAIGYIVVRQKANVSADVKKEQPHISIEVLAEGDITEARVPVNLKDPHEIEKLEKALAKEIKKTIEKGIHKGQKNKADIFQFGEKFSYKHPDKWEKLKGDWNDVTFPSLKVEVKTQAFIRRTGLRNDSSLKEFK